MRTFVDHFVWCCNVFIGGGVRVLPVVKKRSGGLVVSVLVEAGGKSNSPL